MKNSIRVRKNPSAANPAPQAKTTPPKTVTVIFSSIEDGKEMFQVELPEILVAAVRRAAKKMKITPDRFFELAIESKIRSEVSLAAAGGAR